MVEMLHRDVCTQNAEIANVKTLRRKSAQKISDTPPAIGWMSESETRTCLVISSVTA